MQHYVEVAAKSDTSSSATGSVSESRNMWITCTHAHLQTRQAMYVNVIWRLVHEIIVAVEKQYYIFLCVCVRVRAPSVSDRVCARVCGCGCRAQTCAHACVALLTQHATRRHIAICGFWFHRIFRHYLINCVVFGKKLLNIKCVF